MSAPGTERLGIFLYKTSHINFFFVVLLSLLFVETSVSVTSVYLTAYGLNRRNADKHVNVGLQLLQLVCIILNWSTGKWINTLFAGILSLEFVIYFVGSIIAQKSTPPSYEIVLYNLVETSIEGFLLAFLVGIEAVTLILVNQFPQKPIVLGVSAYLLAFPDEVPKYVTVPLLLIGFATHLYLSHLF